MTARPLEGRRVLVTRPEGRGRGLAERLERLGAEVDLRPTIAFEPPRDPSAARARVRDLERFRWLVFTSPTGVRFFFETRTTAGAGPLPAGPCIAAIGRGTAAALEAAGATVERVAPGGRAESLADEILRDCEAGTRVLIVRPEVARDVLPAALARAGVEVEIAVVYRTIASEEAGEVARRIADGNYDLAVFTSPSTFVRLLEAGAEEPGLRTALRSCGRVAIGDVTAAALEREGLLADAVATAPDDDAIAEAVVRVLAR